MRREKRSYFGFLIMKNKLYFEKIENESKGVRLFCFSYAGGGASVFRSWQNRLGDEISVYPAHYPGHEERISEEPVWDMDVLVTNIYEEIHSRDMDKQPFFLFGHSLGSRVAYELALRFEEVGEENLLGIIVSAGRAPNRKEDNPIYHLPETEFFKELSKYNRTPPELFENKALWAIFEPALRADFTVAETYCDKKHRKLHVPILALRGTLDVEMTEEDLKEWQCSTPQNTALMSKHRTPETIRTGTRNATAPQRICSKTKGLVQRKPSIRSERWATMFRRMFC